MWSSRWYNSKLLLYHSSHITHSWERLHPLQASQGQTMVQWSLLPWTVQLQWHDVGKWQASAHKHQAGYVCLYVCMHVCMFSCMFAACMNVCTYLYVRTYVCLYTRIKPLPPNKQQKNGMLTLPSEMKETYYIISYIIYIYIHTYISYIAYHIGHLLYKLTNCHDFVSAIKRFASKVPICYLQCMS